MLRWLKQHEHSVSRIMKIVIISALIIFTAMSVAVAADAFAHGNLFPRLGMCP